eukprot:GDKH01003094.1.p1 GENE.GDKH01003094.1~~GDKH01003094.1.p1  ORF type:complete len:91 (+),score=16.66 GDKH01003094.1:209-481(+)
MAAPVFTRLPVPSLARVFKFDKLYRTGNMNLEVKMSKKTVAEALAASVTKVEFLEVDLLKGVPVKDNLKSAEVDAYLTSHLQEMESVYSK